MQTTSEAMQATNRLLAGFVNGQIPPGMPVVDIAKKFRMTYSQYYTNMKRLRVSGRISKTGPVKVLNANPIDEREYSTLGDPYNKYQKPKKAATKPKKSKTKRPNRQPLEWGIPGEGKTVQTAPPPVGLLNEPLELKVTPSDDQLTLSGSVETMIKFFRAMRGTS